jgi:hypothetical protein
MTRLQWGRRRNGYLIPEKRQGYFVRSSLFWVVTQRLLVVADVLGTTYRSRVQRPSSSRPLTIEVGTDNLSRSVGKYQSKRHNTPEGRRHYLRSGGNLKSHKITLFLETTRPTSCWVILTFICLRRSYISYDLVHRTFTAQVRDVSKCVGARVVEGWGLGTIT